MIQGGCPLGEGIGNPGYSIFGEFDDNGFANNLSHNRGVMSMARSSDFNSAGSQFFICHGDPVFLDGSYAAFGMVTSGMDAVDRYAEIPSHPQSGAVAPDLMPVIKSITIDGDFELPEPDKLSR
jgi:peptidyl-prolyl cis-trans isomerase B (cyclophilin B)